MVKRLKRVVLGAEYLPVCEVFNFALSFLCDFDNFNDVLDDVEVSVEFRRGSADTSGVT